jgi:glycosyltransferase involved in cell wall biosynthesis
MFAYYFPPANDVGGQRPFRFAKYLRRHGYRTHVVTATGHQGESPDVTRIPSAVTYLAAAIQRLAPYNDQLPWISRAVAAAQRIISKERPVALFSTSPPLACHLAALAMKFRYGIPWIADFRDPLLGNPFRTRSWAKPYDLCIERTIVAQADAVIANTDAAAAMMKRRYPRWSRKIHLIWNGYDPEATVAPAPIPPRSHKVLVHAGSIYGARHPSLLVAAIERLVAQRQLDPALVRVRLIGDIDPDWLQVTRRQYRALHVAGCMEYVDRRVPQQQAIREMSEADGLLLLDLNARNATLQVPAKVFDYVLIGRPILAFTGHGSPVEFILRGSEVPHVCIHPGTPEQEVDQKVAKFFALPSQGVTPSCWFREQFDGAVQTAALSSILAGLES